MSSTAPHVYVETDIPAGLTIAEWRRARHAEARRPRRLSLRRLAHRPTFA